MLLAPNDPSDVAGECSIPVPLPPPHAPVRCTTLYDDGLPEGRKPKGMSASPVTGDLWRRNETAARRDEPTVAPANNGFDSPHARHRVSARRSPDSARPFQDRRAIGDVTNRPARNGCRSRIRPRREFRPRLPRDRWRLRRDVLLDRLRGRHIAGDVFLPGGALLLGDGGLLL